MAAAQMRVTSSAGMRMSAPDTPFSGLAFGLGFTTFTGWVSPTAAGGLTGVVRNGWVSPTLRAADRLELGGRAARFRWVLTGAGSPFQPTAGLFALRVDLQGALQVFHAGLRAGHGSQDQPGLLGVRIQAGSLRRPIPRGGTVALLEGSLRPFERIPSPGVCGRGHCVGFSTFSSFR